MYQKQFDELKQQIQALENKVNDCQVKKAKLENKIKAIIKTDKPQAKTFLDDKMIIEKDIQLLNYEIEALKLDIPELEKKADFERIEAIKKERETANKNLKKAENEYQEYKKESEKKLDELKKKWGQVRDVLSHLSHETANLEFKYREKPKPQPRWDKNLKKYTLWNGERREWVPVQKAV